MDSDIFVDILGSIIRFVNIDDIFNLAITSKQLYKAVPIHYPFDDYKLLTRLSDSDFNLVPKNININPEVVFRAIILGNKHQLLKIYFIKIDLSDDHNWTICKTSKKWLPRDSKIISQ